MKTNIKSHNTGLSPGIKELLIQSSAQVLLYLTVALLLLVFLKIKGLWTYFTTGVLAANQSDISDIINEKAQGLHRFLDSISQGRFLQIMFWLFVGCIVYLLIWFFRSIFTNIRNDFVADEYVPPGGYNRTVYWESILARKAFFACILAILIGYTIVGLKIAILLAQIGMDNIEGFQAGHSLIQIISPLGVTALMIHI